MREPPARRNVSAQSPCSSAAAADAAGDPMWSSEKLLCGRREIVIRHGPEQYRLRLTRMNKLILTK